MLNRSKNPELDPYGVGTSGNIDKGSRQKEEEREMTFDRAWVFGGVVGRIDGAVSVLGQDQLEGLRLGD